MPYPTKHRDELIQGRYRVLKRLGASPDGDSPSFWQTYQCRDEHDGNRLVVVKQPWSLDDAVARELFERMCKEFPGRFELHEDEQEPSALVSEYQSGVTLLSWSDEHSPDGQHPSDQLYVLLSLGQALDRFRAETGHSFVSVLPEQMLVNERGEVTLLPNACSLYADDGKPMDVMNFSLLIGALLFSWPWRDRLVLEDSGACEEELSRLDEDKRKVLEQGLHGEVASCVELMQRLFGCYGTLARLGEAYDLKLDEQRIMRMQWIAPGTFEMGSPSTEKGRSENFETLPQQTTIEEGFWLGIYPVTQAEFIAVLGGENTSIDYRDGARCPMDKLNWADAQEFCQKLNERADLVGCLPRGYHFSLPSGAQWEYACRAGSQKALYTGQDLDHDRQSERLAKLAQYNGNKSKRPFVLSDVGRMQPNDWGLYDMLGGVWEWNRDEGKTSDEHWASGGCCTSLAKECRCASRKTFRDEGQSCRHSKKMGMRLAIVKCQ